MLFGVSAGRTMLPQFKLCSVPFRNISEWQLIHFISSPPPPHLFREYISEGFFCESEGFGPILHDKSAGSEHVPNRYILGLYKYIY